MSVESQLERSVLEKKDRDELQSIATAMGGKPGSRARKAEIVDMILELAGVEAGGNGEEPSGNGTKKPKAPAKKSPRSAPKDADESGEDGHSSDDEPSEKGASGKGRRSRTNSDDSTETGNDDANSSDSRAKDREGGSGGRGDRRGGRTQDNQGGRNQGGRSNKGGRNQGGREQDQTEPGNRRRRRRRGGGGGREREEEVWQSDPVDIEGLLDLRDEGYGFLRTKGFLPTKEDVYVSVKQVRQFGLRRGDHLKGTSRPANRNEKNPALLRVDEVNGSKPEAAKERPRFEDLTPLFPDEKLRLERTDDPSNMTSRIIDLISPIGKGQRGLIVSPPKAGKTFVMKTIAQSIEANNPEVHVIVLLVDERPEEVTDMRRSVEGDVVASTFDRPSDEHTTVSELTIERARRMVEMGRDVVIILDGITRLARAYNLAAPATGRIMSGGIDTGALYPPKKFFGSARNIEEGGSLTILATALVETGSKMDEVIFEEFKGTGNMELRLDRGLSERRIYPAIDVDASSTRHEELLYEREQLQMVWKLRRVLSGLAADSGGAAAGLEMLIDRLATFESNDEFLSEVAKAPAVGA